MTATPKSWLSREYDVRDVNAQLVGEIFVSSWRAAGTIRTGETEYGVSRQGALFGAIVQTGPSGEVARAARQGVLSRAFEVEFGGRVVVLRSSSLWFREMRLSENGQVVGTAVPEGVFSRRAQLDLPESLPIELRLFIAWLALYVWSRRRDSSASFTGVLQTAPRNG
jgi:hypothetical protein